MASQVTSVAPFRRRIALSLMLGVGAALLTWVLANPLAYRTDFQYYGRAAQYWLQGIDPYPMQPHTVAWPLQDRFYYPMPAVLLTAPFAWLDLRAAQTVFIAVAAGCLAWRLTREARWPLLIFCTPAFLVASFLGQWSPWLTLGALVPSAGFLLAAKPTLGVACWLYSPTWRAVWSGLALVAVSLAVMPHWPLVWLENLHYVVRHPPPILTPWAAPVALALFRWRERDARFLVAMACVPQLGFFADQLPLFLIAKSRGEAISYLGMTLAVFAVWLSPLFSDGGLPKSAPYALAGSYLPALALVLCRRA